ncbi:hypothetical protein P0W64_00640 [Tsukamurella sp. 8F]|uniref:LGFP repeat-containing protein n=1 Tax=unclassified Tsukamurella TaxID=2633480 RepID=UPI0023B90770|nr:MULTISPECIES: hypothetical protein [unclassified Tsukamurella]MDF0531413.1 hypothetical protein [Tsukamurella sp. 8J]MDF0585281.1 hypothetical protein [Tsukamurella sp. 8F]
MNTQFRKIAVAAVAVAATASVATACSQAKDAASNATAAAGSAAGQATAAAGSAANKATEAAGSAVNGAKSAGNSAGAEASGAAGSGAAGASGAAESGAAGASGAAGGEAKPAVTSTEIKSESGQALSITNAPILAEYAKYGYAEGHLGAPQGAVWTTPDGKGKALTLKGGTIYWSEGSGAHVVHGEIGDKWGTLKHEAGKLGYPTGDEVDADGAITQKFQGGEITFKGGETTVTYN